MRRAAAYVVRAWICTTHELRRAGAPPSLRRTSGFLHLRLIGGGSYRRIYAPSKSFFPVSRHTHNTHQSLHQLIASTYSATAHILKSNQSALLLMFSASNMAAMLMAYGKDVHQWVFINIFPLPHTKHLSLCVYIVTNNFLGRGSIHKNDLNFHSKSPMIFLVERPGFEPFLLAPDQACCHYTRRSICPAASPPEAGIISIQHSTAHPIRPIYSNPDVYHGRRRSARLSPTSGSARVRFSPLSIAVRMKIGGRQQQTSKAVFNNISCCTSFWFAPLCPAGMVGAPWPLERICRYPGSN